MKTYVLMVARHYPRGVTTEVETRFHEKILSGEKIHTIRSNYDLWRKRFDDIESGSAYLSLRTWQDKPYRSKQIEFNRLDTTHGIGIQRITGLKSKNMLTVAVDSKLTDWTRIARNDGLTFYQFTQWFYMNPNGIDDGVIIHFTNFRY